MQAFHDLVTLVERLRGDDGCPWDRAQDATSLRPHLLGELAELLDAIDEGDRAGITEELGDLLFVIVLTAQAAGADLATALHGVQQKMIRRHPHVFADAERPDWSAAKAAERPGRRTLDGTPASLPALAYAQDLTHRAAKVGFDWPDRVGVRAKIDEELVELDAAIEADDPAAMADELGDVLLSVVNLARFLPGTTPGTTLHAEHAMRGAAHKFRRRFEVMEAALDAAGTPVATLDADTLDAAWRAAKLSLSAGDDRR